MDALQTLSNYKNVSNIPHILFGTLVVDIIAILLAKNTTLLGRVLKRWYDQFDLSAVIADVLVIVLGILIAQYIYTEFFKSYGPLAFLVIIVLVQIIHDILFYVGVIQTVPFRQNKVMDIFSDYAKEAGARIIAGDAVLMLASVTIAAASLHLSTPLFAFLGILAVYVVPYAIY